MKECIVIIPVYKKYLNEYERISVSRTCEVLARHDIAVIHPVGLDTTFLSTDYPGLKFQPFPPDYFSGIMGYNRLMLSQEFYATFADYEYMLICQTDAYVFNDRLHEWCEAGYDYVGAPWLRKPVYNLPLVKQWMQMVRAATLLRGRKSKQDLYDKIGNGGFSLRRIDSHLRAVRTMPDKVKLYLDREKKNHLYNEDVFWATEPQDFRYPPVDEALRFAFDKYPALCFRLSHERLPMGCHAWWKRKMRAFWMKIRPEMFPAKS